jgi:hypothetical protein
MRSLAALEMKSAIYGIYYFKRRKERVTWVPQFV